MANNNMQQFIVGITIVGITLVLAIYITAEISETMDTGSIEQNAAIDVVNALAGGTPWITILIVVGFAVIVLGMLTSGLGRIGGTVEGPVY
jgi:hypothetical protein